MRTTRNPSPAQEVDTLRGEAEAAIDHLRVHVEHLLEIAADTRVLGLPPPDIWRDLDHSVRSAATEAVAAVAESIAAYIDEHQERLLAALAPVRDERLIWAVPRVFGDGLDDAESIEFVICVDAHRQWVVRSPNRAEPGTESATGLLLRFVLAEWMGIRDPLWGVVLDLEAQALREAERLADADAAEEP